MRLHGIQKLVAETINYRRRVLDRAMTTLDQAKVPTQFTKGRLVELESLTQELAHVFDQSTVDFNRAAFVRVAQTGEEPSS